MGSPNGMLQLKEACCCLTLRTGNLILGWLGLIFGVLTLISLAAIFPLIDQMDEKKLPEGLSKSDLKIFLGVLLAFVSISPIISACHVYGSTKYRKGFLLPYLIIGGIQLVFIALAVIVSLFKGLWQPFIVNFLTFLFSGYFYLIPLSFYKEIRDGRHPVGGQA